MMTKIKLGTIEAEVTFKEIKNVHLSVHPPLGRVRIAAPSRMKLDTVRVFAISKLGWIKQQQQKLLQQERETQREYVDRESHYVWGERKLLSVVEKEQPPTVSIQGAKIILSVRPGAGREQRHEIIEQWYREQVRSAAPELISTWEKRLDVAVQGVYIQRMRTRWGSCNPSRATIRLNTDLARKPRQCLEYIVVHELMHLLEPTHNARFVALMDHHFPQWPEHRDLLNRLPVRHEDWQY